MTNVVTGKDIPKIDATANVWCGNTVRLQVSQYDVTQNTTPDGGGCDTSFLDQALGPEVHEAETDGLVVVINDQTESDSAAVSGLAQQELGPTKATFAFWNCVTQDHENWGSNKTYAQDQQVVFDIFNEPRADACSSDHGPNGPYDMNLWRNGGMSDGICGPAVNYQGMDAVAYHMCTRSITRMPTRTPRPTRRRGGRSSVTWSIILLRPASRLWWPVSGRTSQPQPRTRIRTAGWTRPRLFRTSCPICRRSASA